MILLSHQIFNTFFYIPLTKCFTLYLGHTSSQLTMKRLLQFGSTLIPIYPNHFKIHRHFYRELRMCQALQGRINKYKINTFLQDPTDLLFAFKCNVLSAILKVYFKYDQNRDKNDKLPEKVG